MKTKLHTILDKLKKTGVFGAVTCKNGQYGQYFISRLGAVLDGEEVYLVINKIGGKETEKHIVEKDLEKEIASQIDTFEIR